MDQGAAPAEDAWLDVRQVTKNFPGVRALSEVNLQLGRGEVLALIGENGAGKSTLMKILAGVQKPDSGTICIDGKSVEFDNVRMSLDSGIALIHQELNLADNLQVGANIYLGREPRRLGLIDSHKLNAAAETVLKRVGLNVSPKTPLAELSLGQQQLVEIAKAMSVNARVLIMDEPTSSLSSREAARLFEVVKELRSDGISVIYISHRLGEVKELADRVTVLRDGCNAGELSREEITHDNMVRLMVGRDVSQFYSRQQHAIGNPVLEVKNLVTRAWPAHEVNLAVSAGEIVGVAGLIGAGRTEMLRTLFGIDQPLRGTVSIDGKVVSLSNPADAISAGIALVPEDRKQHGLVIDMSVRRNSSLAGLWRNRFKRRVPEFRS